MNAVGVVVEYNPFHNGHAYHLEMAKKTANAEVVIAAMSGNFLQRGEPALLSKWARAKMALLGGADLVFELPYQFATQKAETFANGAVSLLSSVGCQSICFGSEDGDVNRFYQTASFINNHHDEFQMKIKYHIEKGISYPSAISQAFKDLSPDEEVIDLSKPNNILGFHYLQAVQKLAPSINIFTVSRKSANYHDEHFASSTIASATSIRKTLFSDDGSIQGVKQYVPESTYRQLVDYYHAYGSFHSWENYWPLLRFRLLQTNPEELRRVYEVEEGIEHRLISIALTSNSFYDFMKKLKTKRYTWTRLQRICLHVLTNSLKSEMSNHDEQVKFLRLLGMTEKGKMYLNKMKGQTSVPIVSKLSAHQHEPAIKLDIRASRLFALGAIESKRQLLLDLDYKQPPIIIRKQNKNGTQ
ncbi:nucleotidyltransferase [Cytobacillus spongiae]|jgi:predicted nucleotidyltransferase|uniref:nucleotidyltransferase n=1 Tax=Cytobacillus spongiae TaxID=2901381 RepID=UPI001F39050C|nr:nucleotidyltransferase [Cytobacillus spongiae]UII57298.1 nucleotidyltransferase [Cytobacillus spongiae]